MSGRHVNIPIFVPHLGCPFQCIFCNQKKISGTAEIPDGPAVRKTVDSYLETIDREKCSVEIAFFGGSFTAVPQELQRELLESVQDYVEQSSAGIRISTRPDFIDQEILDRLKEYHVTTIELGVQSMCDDVLLSSGRGHTAEDVRRAAKLIRQNGFSLGLQMMPGLPGDTVEKSVRTAEEIIALQPDIVRIYPTLVVKDTVLAQLYQAGEYTPLSVEEAAELCAGLLERFYENGIRVIRVGLCQTDSMTPDGDIVAGPYHPAFRELCEGKLYLKKLCEILDKRKVQDRSIIIYADKSKFSYIAGHNRDNIRYITEKYRLQDVGFCHSSDGKLRIETVQKKNIF